LIGAIMEAIETAAAEQSRAKNACCVGTGLATGQRYLVPFDTVALRDVGSTGLAAGIDRSDATRRGLLECIERDALQRWLAGAHGIRMASRFEPGPRWHAVKRLRGICVGAEIQPIFWRIDTGLGVPTVLCQLFDHSRECSEIWGYTAGSASAPLWREAATRALLEAVQTRIALRLHESAYVEGRSRRFRLERFGLEWARAISARPGAPPSDGAKHNSTVLLARRILRLHGVEPVVVPLTPASAFPAVVRVLIPGFRAPRPAPPAKGRAADDPRRPRRAA
jgi:ribosomal protein S12 methylthiotransferase accessory factor YcaO